MPVTTGSIPKAVQGERMKRSTQKLQHGLSAAKIMPADKKADAMMTPAMISKDIAADKKNLADKLSNKNKK